MGVGLELPAPIWRPKIVRRLVALGCLCLAACSPKLEFNVSQQMSPDEMLQRATHAFIGVIEDQQFQYSPFLRVPGFPDMDRKEQRYWRVLRRRVHVELLLKGSEPRKEVDVFEIFWTGGASGDWNSTQNNERDLFLVRVENGRYHVVRD